MSEYWYTWKYMWIHITSHHIITHNIATHLPPLSPYTHTNTNMHTPHTCIGVLIAALSACPSALDFSLSNISSTLTPFFLDLFLSYIASGKLRYLPCNNSYVDHYFVHATIIRIRKWKIKNKKIKKLNEYVWKCMREESQD